MSESSSVAGDDAQCHFVLEKKRRRCRMPLLAGEQFCVEHIGLAASSHQAVTDLGASRIPCPLDPSHTCFANKLSGHLARCNARAPAVAPPYYRHNINAGSGPAAAVAAGPLLHATTDTHLMALIGRIDAAYQELVPDIPDMFCSHPVLDSSLLCPEYGASTRKHLQQNSSLLGLLERAQLLGDDFTYVEMGSGKAQLSYWLARAVAGSGAARVLLVDRQSHRHKAENRLRELPDTPPVQRLKIDIGHLRLAGCALPSGATSRRPAVVVIGKHLCGAASDMALRAATAGCEQCDSVTPEGASAVPSDSAHTGPGPCSESCSRVELVGLLIALCCHHRVDFASYVGLDFLLSRCGLAARDLNCLKGIAAWATCGTADWSDTPAPAGPHLTRPPSCGGRSSPTGDARHTSAPASHCELTESPCPEDSGDGTDTPPTHSLPSASDQARPVDTSQSRYRRLGLSPSRRAQLGLRCKRLLDLGRVDWLLRHPRLTARQPRLTARLVRYVPEAITPENIALLVERVSD